MTDTTAVVTGPKIRLMHCPVCDSVEEIPDFDGPPEHDVLLQAAIQRSHVDTGRIHHVRLFDVVEKVWALPSYKQGIIEQIRGGSKGMAAIDPNYYTVRDTFREDAMSCYNLHLRPKEGCPDYRSDRKILLPDTGAERKELGLSKPGAGRSPVHWLCSFCPVESFVNTKRQQRS